MNDHPATLGSAESEARSIAWNDHATLHKKDEGEGVLAGFKVLRQGSIAELVAFVSRLPETDRAGYVILKTGERRLDLAEIMALSRRADFPG